MHPLSLLRYCLSSLNELAEERDGGDFKFWVLSPSEQREAEAGSDRLAQLAYVPGEN